MNEQPDGCEVLTKDVTPKPEPKFCLDITPKQAMDALRRAMQKDIDYAWSWHCNVAMAAFDAGAPIREANERAADFIRNAFDVDVRASDQWKNIFMVPLADDNARHDPVNQPAHDTQGHIPMIEIDQLDYTGDRPEVFFRFRGIEMSADLDPGVLDPVVIRGSAVGFDIDVKFSEYKELQAEINRFVKTG